MGVNYRALHFTLISKMDEKVVQALKIHAKKRRRLQKSLLREDLNRIVRDISANAKALHKELLQLQDGLQELETPNPSLADELLAGPVITLGQKMPLDENIFCFTKPGEQPDKSDRVVVDCWEIEFPIKIDYGRKVHMAFDAEVHNPIKYLKDYVDEEIPFTIDRVDYAVSKVVRIGDWKEDFLHAEENKVALERGDEEIMATAWVLRIRQ
jgi:hypothetical protein